MARKGMNCAGTWRGLMKASALGLWCGKGIGECQDFFHASLPESPLFQNRHAARKTGKYRRTGRGFLRGRGKCRASGKRNAPFWMPCWTGRMTRLLWQPKCRKKSPRGRNSTRPLRQAENEAGNNPQKMDDMRSSLRDKAGPGARPWTQEALPFAISAACPTSMATENSFCRNWTNRINEQRRRQPASLSPACFGHCLAVAGAASLLAFGWGILPNFRLRILFAWPVNLWSGYLCICTCGVALAGGLPRSGP